MPACLSLGADHLYCRPGARANTEAGTKTLDLGWLRAPAVRPCALCRSTAEIGCFQGLLLRGRHTWAEGGELAQCGARELDGLFLPDDNHVRRCIIYRCLVIGLLTEYSTKVFNCSVSPRLGTSFSSLPSCEPSFPCGYHHAFHHSTKQRRRPRSVRLSPASSTLLADVHCAPSVRSHQPQPPVLPGLSHCRPSRPVASQAQHGSFDHR